MAQSQSQPLPVPPRDANASHRALHHGRRVRIDSLGLEAAGCGWACLAYHRRTWPAVQAFGQQAARCAVGARLGLRGHAGPGCMAGTDNVSEAAAAAAQCKERESQAMLGDVDSVL